MDDLTSSKTLLENAEKGIFREGAFSFFEERFKAPTVFEQITVKYRLQERGPLIVETYRTDIHRGDTVFYPLKGKLLDYLK